MIKAIEDTPIKTCTKCRKKHPATLQYFYKNGGGKYGVTPRCKPCVNEDNRASHLKRMAKEPAKIREQANLRSRRSYAKNIEICRAKNREHAAKNRACPATRAKINMAKRGGGARLTISEFSELFNSQGRSCAICSSKNPGGKAGWNVDHCHKTGMVRFILCVHCNRGLGAFRDRPDLMRIAADKLEEIYQDQPDEPVAARDSRIAGFVSRFEPGAGA